MAKSQIAFDIAIETPTTFSADQKGTLSWAEQLDLKEGDKLQRDKGHMITAEFTKLQMLQDTTLTVQGVLIRHDAMTAAIRPQFSN
jgi:hypothetical protein